MQSRLAIYGNKFVICEGEFVICEVKYENR